MKRPKAPEKRTKAPAKQPKAPAKRPKAPAKRPKKRPRVRDRFKPGPLFKSARGEIHDRETEGPTIWLPPPKLPLEKRNELLEKLRPIVDESKSTRWSRIVSYDLTRDGLLVGYNDSGQQFFGYRIKAEAFDTGFLYWTPLKRRLGHFAFAQRAEYVRDLFDDVPPDDADDLYDEVPGYVVQVYFG